MSRACEVGKVCCNVFYLSSEKAMVLAGMIPDSGDATRHYSRGIKGKKISYFFMCG